jgi:hypothetical protein
LLLLLSFVMFILGFTGMAMMLLGLNWSFMTWLDVFGRTFGLVIRLLMVMGGLVLFVVCNTNWDKEKSENLK